MIRTQGSVHCSSDGSSSKLTPCIIGPRHQVLNNDINQISTQACSKARYRPYDVRFNIISKSALCGTLFTLGYNDISGCNSYIQYDVEIFVRTGWCHTHQRGGAKIDSFCFHIFQKLILTGAKTTEIVFDQGVNPNPIMVKGVPPVMLPIDGLTSLKIIASA